MTTKVAAISFDDSWVVCEEITNAMDDEGTKAVKYHFNKSINNTQIAQFAQTIQKIEQYSKQGKLYELLALELDDIDTNNTHFKAYKEVLKTTLHAYTFLNCASSSKDKYGILKITGEDFSDVQRSSPIPLSSPFDIKKSSLFKITPVAAKALCMVIAENREIDSLILSSVGDNQSKDELDKDDLGFEFIEAPNTNNASVSQKFFDDEVARIFAESLPQNRFQLLHIAGDFGNGGATALASKLPALLVHSPKEIQGVKILGANVDKAMGVQIAKQVQNCVQNRLAKELNFMMI